VRTWIGEVKLDRLSARLKILLRYGQQHTNRANPVRLDRNRNRHRDGRNADHLDRRKLGARDGKQERARAIGVVEQFDGITVQDVAIFVTNELGIAVL
jgi:hypothetical protein